MSEVDLRTYEYMSENTRFADLFNYFLHDGKRVIKPENLRELDSREWALPYGIKADGDTAQRYRDILKNLCAREDNQASYLLLGIENQKENHYAMPVRNMLYDALQYAKQVSSVAKRHRKNRDDSNMLPGEYLSGFHKDDRLVPVITLVIYWSSEEWDGPKTLHEMFSTEDENVLKYISDYKLNIISPRMIPDEDFCKFDTTIAEVFKYIKYSGDKEALNEIVSADKMFQQLDGESIKLINAVTKSNLRFNDEGKVVNVCKALEDMKAEAIKNTSVEIAKSLIELGKITIEEIAKVTNLTIEEVKELKSAQ